MDDCLIVGAGVIGLSLAYELARSGIRVRVIDSGSPGKEASWAGAGILPPGSARSPDPLERLRALSNPLHAEWAERLRDETGIDNGYRRCGGLYLARDAQSAAAVRQEIEAWRRLQIRVEELSDAALQDVEPQLRSQRPIAAAYLLADEAQLRNPRHLKALIAACLKHGVEITAGARAEEFEIHDSRVQAVVTAVGRLAAGSVCITAGSWTAALLGRLGHHPAIKPIRGQMVLFSALRPLFSRIINEGPRYLVPRADGRMLAGSTEEDVGFDRSTTAVGTDGLRAFAIGLVPALAEVTLEDTWAGLRPGTRDGRPYVGRVAGCENLFVAAGHFRNGLQLSTGTAVVLARLVRGEDPQFDLTAFRLDRD